MCVAGLRLGEEAAASSVDRLALNGMEVTSPPSSLSPFLLILPHASHPRPLPGDFQLTSRYRRT